MADNIYEVNGNSYRVKICYYQDNKKKVFSKYFLFEKYGGKANAFKQAKTCRDQFKTQYNVNGYVIPNRVKLRDIMLLKCELFPLAPETEKKHWIYFDKFIEPIGKYFGDVTPADIQLSLNRSSLVCSNDAISRVLSIWRYMYKAAGLAQYNIPDRTYAVYLPKSQLIHRTRDLDFNGDLFSEILSKLDKSKKPNYHVVSSALKTMAILGLRPAETYSLQSCDIDTGNMTVSINKSCTAKGKITKTKNEYSQRTIPYSAKYQNFFQDLKKADGYIFKKANGNLLGSNYVTAILRNLSNGRFRPYMLRHRLSTELIVNKNIDPRTVQHIMGHKNVSQTISYALPKEEKIRSALDENDISF